MDKINPMLLLISLLIILQSCSPESKGQKTIDRAIDAHGGKGYESAVISFDFRDIHYQILKTPSQFEYSRTFTDSIGAVVDLLNQDGLVRTVNGNETDVSGEKNLAYSNSVNSVAYFVFLPYGLNDPAVQKEWLGETRLEGRDYDLIKVTFTEEDGGEDFDDVFLYWINKESGHMDFLAYTYHTEGGGVRFRKAINPRTVNGIRIQDYENYMPEDKDTPVEKMQELYQSGQLELLSEIVLENVEVEKVE